MRHELIQKDLLQILICPICKSDIILTNESITCKNISCGEKYPIIKGIPIMLPRSSNDFTLTQKKWNQEYENKYSRETIDFINNLELRDAYEHVKKYYTKSQNGLFLEAGCGPSRLSCLLAKEKIKTIGIDFSLNALLLAKGLFKREGVEGLFVCGDILRMPFRDNSFTFSYTGGVLEHIKDIQGAVNAIYRCLVPGGFTTNTVPHLALITPYRIIRYGNIPDIPVLREILEFIQVELLKGKYMRFGYEKSLSSQQMKKYFLKAGFKKIETGLFRTYYPLEIVPNKNLQKKITRIVNSSKYFWPMIYINGEK